MDQQPTALASLQMAMFVKSANQIQKVWRISNCTETFTQGAILTVVGIDLQTNLFAN